MKRYIPQPPTVIVQEVREHYPLDDPFDEWGEWRDKFNKLLEDVIHGNADFLLPEGIFWPYLKQILDNYCEALQVVIDRYKAVDEDSRSPLERCDPHDEIKHLYQTLDEIDSGCIKEIKGTTATILPVEGEAVLRDASLKIKRRIRRRIKKKSHLWGELHFFKSIYKNALSRVDMESLLDLEIPPSENEILTRALTRWIQSKRPRRINKDLNTISAALWERINLLENAERRREQLRRRMKRIANEALLAIFCLILIALLVLLAFWEMGYWN
jgi:hypothetical protein